MGKTKTLINCSAFFLFIIICLFFTNDLQAMYQDTYRIETTDGNVIFGTLVSEDEEIVVIQTETIGLISIEKINIRSMIRFDAGRIRDGRYWFDNPQGTRYLFAPNAIGLERGKGYYQNTWIFFNNLNVGLTDNVSIGGGLVPMFLLGVSGTPVWILPKVSFPVARDKFYLAAGGMLGGVVGEDTEGFGILYGTGTLGNRDKNLTVGLGYGYAGGNISSSPMINISGMLRTGRTIYLLSENYFFPETDFTGLISMGIRWAPENFAVDFGLIRPLEEAGSLIGIPWLGVTIPFGHVMAD